MAYRRYRRPQPTPLRARRWCGTLGNGNYLSHLGLDSALHLYHAFPLPNHYSRRRDLECACHSNSSAQPGEPG